MVHDAGHAFEEPGVRDVADDEHIARVGLGSEAAPVLGYDGALTGLADDFEEEFCEGVGVVDDDGAEADVDWGWACCEEGGEGWGGGVGCHEREEEEPGDCDVRFPVFGFGD